MACWVLTAFLGQIRICQVLRAAWHPAPKYLDCHPPWRQRIPQVSWVDINIHLQDKDKVELTEPRLSDRYAFKKPNDRRALDLMNAAAIEVMKDLTDLCVGYGVSDEYSFVFHPSCQLFERRNGLVTALLCIWTWGYWCFGRKLVTTVVSTFTAHYIHLWSTYFPDTPLQSPYLPSFDGRAVVYPSLTNLRDYMSWRQVDCKRFSCLVSVVFPLSCAYMGL